MRAEKPIISDEGPPEGGTTEDKTPPPVYGARTVNRLFAPLFHSPSFCGVRWKCLANAGERCRIFLPKSGGNHAKRPHFVNFIVFHNEATIKHTKRTKSVFCPFPAGLPRCRSPPVPFLFTPKPQRTETEVSHELSLWNRKTEI